MPAVILEFTDTTKVNQVCKSIDHQDAKTQFLKDFFRTGTNFFSDGETILLSFDLGKDDDEDDHKVGGEHKTAEYKAILSNSSGTQSVDIPLDIYDPAKLIPGEIVPHRAGTIRMPEAQLKELKAAELQNPGLFTKPKSLREIRASEAHSKALYLDDKDRSFLRYIEAFIEPVLDKDDRNLVYYASQAGLFFFAGLFIKKMPNGHLSCGVSLNGKPSSIIRTNETQVITVPGTITFYALDENDEPIMTRNYNSFSNTIIKEIDFTINAIYDRNTGELSKAPEIVLSFPESFTPEQIQSTTQELLEHWKVRRQAEIDDGKPDPGEVKPKLQSYPQLKWRPITKILLGLAITLFSAALLLAILSGIGTLPTLAFMGAALTIGSITLSSSIATAFFIGALGCVAAGLSAATAVRTLKQVTAAPIAIYFTQRADAAPTATASGTPGSITPSAVVRTPSSTASTETAPSPAHLGPENGGHNISIHLATNPAPPSATEPTPPSFVKHN